MVRTSYAILKLYSIFISYMQYLKATCNICCNVTKHWQQQNNQLLPFYTDYFYLQTIHSTWEFSVKVLKSHNFRCNQNQTIWLTIKWLLIASIPNKVGQQFTERHRNSCITSSFSLIFLPNKILITNLS